MAILLATCHSSNIFEDIFINASSNYYSSRSDYLLPSYSLFFNSGTSSRELEKKLKKKSLTNEQISNNKIKKVLSSTSAQVLKDFQTQNNNIPRSQSVYQQHAATDAFKNNEQNSERHLTECEKFCKSYPWMGLDIPEVVDKSLENVFRRYHNAI